MEQSFHLELGTYLEDHPRFISHEWPSGRGRTLLRELINHGHYRNHLLIGMIFQEDITVFLMVAYHLDSIPGHDYVVKNGCCTISIHSRNGCLGCRARIKGPKPTPKQRHGGSCHTVDGRNPAPVDRNSIITYPIIYRVLHIPGGCLGFLNHQQKSLERNH